MAVIVAGHGIGLGRGLVEDLRAKKEQLATGEKEDQGAGRDLLPLKRKGEVLQEHQV